MQRLEKPSFGIPTDLFRPVKSEGIVGRDAKGTIFMKSKFLRMLLVFSIISGCVSTSQASHSTEASFTPTSLSTYIPAVSPSPTHVDTKPSVAPTLTLISTLPPEEKVIEVERLQETNGDCQWPCWWGITPGITTWTEASNFLQTLSIGNTSVTKMPYIVYLTAFPRQDARKLFVDFYVERQDNVIDVIFLSQNLSLNDFLRLQGKPDEIRISSDGIVPGPSDFRIVFFYPEKGIMAAYFGYSDLISRGGVEYIKMCVPDFNSSGPLWLWNPDSKKRFDELPLEHLIGGHPTSLKLKRIGEYTNVDERSFFNSVLKDPENTCLETRADIWPNPDHYATPTP